jgi:hypothetical protein
VCLIVCVITETPNGAHVPVGNLRKNESMKVMYASMTKGKENVHYKLLKIQSQ